MSFKWSFSVFLMAGICLRFAGTVSAQNAGTVSAQKLPLQQDVLQSMRAANDLFVHKRPDPGASIVAGAADLAEVGGQSNARTRAIYYYEGLMALNSVDRKQEYYDRAVNWGAKYGIDGKPARIAAIRMTIDTMLAADRRDAPVLAALVQVLSLLPVNEPRRAEYLQAYLDIVHTIVPLQRADGYWNVSLYDSTDSGELSGTALFTYGISWGIRQGFLDKKTYSPVVTLAWNAIDKVQELAEYDLGCWLLAGSEVYQMASTTDNRDESKVSPYTEPDVLKMKDGGVVRSAKEWEKVQRPYVYGLFEKDVYGRMPVKTVPVTYTVESVDSSAVEGLAIRKEVTIHFSATDTAARLRVVVILPKKARRAVPVFVGYSFRGNATVTESSEWPLKEMVSRGYGLVSAWYWDLEPDNREGWQTGIRTKLAGALQIEPYEWGAIGAWAWGLNRIADYLGTEKGVGKLIVFGHSRLGKVALWAAASDRRWALVVSNESGEGGAALSKRDFGETVAIINNKFPYWFCPAYKQFGSNTATLPVDQHMLLALMAPRPLYVASAQEDLNSDPKGEFLGAQLAGPVYQLFGKRGVDGDGMKEIGGGGKKGVGAGEMPAVGHPVGDVIRYHIRSGKHDITLYDWEQYLDFADRQLK